MGRVKPTPHGPLGQLHDRREDRDVTLAYLAATQFGKSLLHRPALYNPDSGAVLRIGERTTASRRAVAALG